ncbi:hypothetical protein [Acidomonas methanolica]|uniref:Rod shape-determining protein MreD n=1 Tax=Acidomonas methanolica NBRC 104435 TaxID=1231351 RepID=A0A023D493_ACIMT|nr:hypothetical protein [Acidomonas methanolica]MBU2654441.1 hypothetical protein [Acidomonas methanolica]TCS28245.1 rod shape-determining protein MreD [Acidomonas methanolica]GAJ28621.1 rod shape-determining protein MreD [Acidomonas methanolica NBRC 104435]GBQ54314.1 rod shape-determining protein MreD [Acidomonas methanolica]GEK98962.1 hypothetical protein AME01nite_14610 [Acidomonas methanolica NBRC 104435]
MRLDLPPPSSQPGIEPRASLRRRLDVALRLALPWVSLLVCVFLLSAFSSLPGESALLFGICLGSVYFWSAHLPESMPSWAVFLVGLEADLISFGPPGTILIALLVVHGVAHTWRYGLSRINFLPGWGLFAALCIILSLFQWVVACVGALRFIPPMSALFQAGLSIGIYPTLSALFVRVHRAIVNPDRA